MIFVIYFSSFGDQTMIVFCYQRLIWVVQIEGNVKTGQQPRYYYYYYEHCAGIRGDYNVISRTIVARPLFLLHLDGKKKKKGLVNALYNFCSQNPHFLGFYAWLLIGVKLKGQKRFVDRWEWSWCNHPVLPTFSKGTQSFSVL